MFWVFRIGDQSYTFVGSIRDDGRYLRKRTLYVAVRIVREDDLPIWDRGERNRWLGRINESAVVLVLANEVLDLLIGTLRMHSSSSDAFRAPHPRCDATNVKLDVLVFFEARGKKTVPDCMKKPCTMGSVGKAKF
jgi:hypothetical protein